MKPFSELALGPRVANTKSFVVRRVTSADGTLLVAKYPRKLNLPSRQALQRQFRVLTEVRSRLGNTLKATVPRPIEVTGDILLMTLVPGVSLEDILRLRANAAAGWANRNSLRAIGRNVGTWLGNFHTATNSRNTDDPFHSYISDLEANAHRCGAAGVSKTLLSQVSAHARGLLAAQHAGHHRVSASHGDFLPQNILISGSNVGVVDFDNYSRSAPVYADLATLLAYLSLLAAKREYSRSALDSFSEGLLWGYGNKVDLQLVKLCLFNAVLRIMLDGNVSFSGRQCHALERVLSDALDDRILGLTSVSASVDSTPLTAVRG